MQVKSINSPNFNGKIKVKASEKMTEALAFELKRLKQDPAQNWTEVDLKALADKISDPKIFQTPIQKDGFCYILTDDDAKKASSFSTSTTLGTIYRNKNVTDEQLEKLKTNKAKYIEHVIDEAEQIGEIYCKLSVIG